MPSFSRGNDGLDKEYFEELQEKCRFLGISLKEKDFRKNPDKYIEAAATTTNGSKTICMSAKTA